MPEGDAAERAAVERALSTWDPGEFESAASEKGLVVAKVRSFDEWDRHPHAEPVRSQPLVAVEKINESAPVPLSSASPNAPPLGGLRVLDLTRILAGPVCGRTLATYGAEVMLVTSPKLPEMVSIIDTSRGKLSAQIDLARADGKEALGVLVKDADVFVQGYRPGGMAALGFGPDRTARGHRGLVYVSLSAYGREGPWSAKRGFDSLVQAATGFNDAEGNAAGAMVPTPLPVQILDYATGFLMAFGAQVALLRRAAEGGSWHVQVSLARTAQWLRDMGRIEYVPRPRPDYDRLVREVPSRFGRLVAVPHAASFSVSDVRTALPSVPPGTHAPRWPDGVLH